MPNRFEAEAMIRDLCGGDQPLQNGMIVFGPKGWVFRQMEFTYTSDPESTAYTGIDNAQAGTVYATVADLNALRVAVENLRVLVESMKDKMDT